jgi:DNA-directed RNA polymerase specialized sigma24 family protein
MRQLSPVEQRVLYLNIISGFTIDEIAQALGKGKSAVKMTALRARKKFRTLYLQKYRSPIYLRGEQNEKI